jgi:hypothetical protein
MYYPEYLYWVCPVVHVRSAALWQLLCLQGIASSAWVIEARCSRLLKSELYVLLTAWLALLMNCLSHTFTIRLLSSCTGRRMRYAQLQSMHMPSLTQGSYYILSYAVAVAKY